MTSTGSTAPAGAGEDLLRRRGGETVLITGASSGIGRELARQFGGDGADLVLIARSEDRLRELAGELAADYGVTVEVVPADLSRPGSPDQIVETLARQHIPAWPRVRRTRGSRRRPAPRAAGCSGGASWTPAASPGPGTMACGGVRPWSFQRCFRSDHAGRDGLAGGLP